MGRKLLLAIALVALTAVPAFASVQNIKVSGDIDTTGVIRNNFDLGANIASDRNQHVVLTQTRLRVDADLTDNVGATIALINEREWGNNDDDQTGGDEGVNDIDINLAFVQLREMLYSPLTVYVGRQHLNYGNAFIIGASGPNNAADGRLNGIAKDLTKRTAFDAIRAVLDYNPLTIDVFAASVDQGTVTGADIDDDVNLYGINANYQLGDEMNTIVEAYFFTKHSDEAAVLAGTVGAKADRIYVPGLRVSTNPISGLNLQAEVAWQKGHITSTNGAPADNIERNAMAGQLIANYAVPVAEQYNPMVTAVYTYTSGDKNVANGRDIGDPASQEEYTAWDPLYEDQAGGTIYNTLFNLSNSHIVVISGQITPLEDVTTKLSWTGLWLDKRVQSTTGAAATSMSLLQPDTGAITVAINDESHIGNEVDLDVTYDYTEDVQLGVNAGIFLPGDLFHSNNDQNATQLLANVAVAF